MKKPLFVMPDTYDPPLNVAATKVTVLASANETQGQEFTHQSGPEGTGPMPHSHGWDEAFFVIRGSVEITCGNETTVCRPGAFAFVPGGTIHSFKYGPGGGEMLEITGAGSAAVQMFTDLNDEFIDGPPDMEKLAEVLGRTGAKVHL